MRSSPIILATVAAITLLTAGCTGPEQKLGRGIRNSIEFARMGEIRYSAEQSALFDGRGASYTTGVIRGINRSIARTLAGAFEIATFPIPPYDPLYSKAGSLVYPESYKPDTLADPLFSPDANFGFSGGDVAPFMMGSRFGIFDP
jgi:putative exosortase-associated protein (TIGR04073 family)